MRCIDKECKYRELNGGDDVSDFYFCKYCGMAVNRGEDECLVDKWFFGEQEIEDDDHPCNTCSKKDYCDGWDAQFRCTLCYYYSDEPDCENCDPMDI